MAIESPSVEAYYRELLDGYLSHLHDNDISSVTDYLSKFEEVNIDKSDYDYLDEEFDPQVFFRCFPENGQRVMLAGINPGLKCVEGSTFNPEYWESTPEYWYTRFQAADGDVSRIAREGANNLGIYLSEKELTNYLRNHLSLLSDDGSLDEYFQNDRAAAYRSDPDNEQGVDVTQGFFGDIYYSQYCKLATPNGDDISKLGVSDFAKEQFRKEVFEVIQPDLLVIAGQKPWKAIYDETDDENIEPYCDSNLTDNYTFRSQGGAPLGLYEFTDEDMFVVTTKHFRFGHANERLDRLREILEQADKLIA